MNCARRILGIKGIKPLLGVFFVAILSFSLSNKAIAENNDFSFDKPQKIKFDKGMGSKSFDRTQNKNPTLDNSILTIPKPPDYTKYRQPELHDLNKGIPKPDYPKFNDKRESNSLNKFLDKIFTPSVDNPVSPITKPEYIKYKQPELPDLNKGIPNADYIKYKQPELPDLNKDAIESKKRRYKHLPTQSEKRLGDTFPNN